MGEGFIVRRGGAVTEQALAPTITEVSTTDSEIVFTITNNDASTAVILWEVDDSSPDANSIELAAAATSSNITVDTLDDDTEYTVSATASVTGKVLSNVASLAIETDPAPVYTAATGGTTEEYDDDGKRYKSHTFTSNGTFEVTQVGDATDDRNKVDYLIIAGGGGGGWSLGGGGGGGGAGGYRTSLGTSGADSSAESKPTVTTQSYSITIGLGGAGRTGSNGTGTSGTNSSVPFSSTITSVGGGGGGGNSAAEAIAGLTGGSGGGGSANGTVDNSGAGTANQGFKGGRGDDGLSVYTAGGGGGGAGVIGSNAGSSLGGNGGNGLANLLRTGSNETRAGGGGGGTDGSTTRSSGGTGGGGQGGSSNANSTAATASTGSGGGGGGRISGAGTNGSNGADGIVIIRYEIAPSV
jgi:hypothetical protein